MARITSTHIASESKNIAVYVGAAMLSGQIRKAASPKTGITVVAEGFETREQLAFLGNEYGSLSLLPLPRVRLATTINPSIL